jgi:hypothetical protein
MMIKFRQQGFGIDDRLRCPDCGGTLDLRRRTPDPLHGIHYELQTFLCRSCGRDTLRSVDSLGQSPVVAGIR